MTIREIVEGHKDGTLHGFSLAEAMHDYIEETGATQASIAEQLGISEAYISRLVGSYTSACPDLRDAWARGLVSLRCVFRLSGESEDAQREAVKKGPPPVQRARNMPTRAEIESVFPFVVAQSDIYRTLKWVLGEGPCPVEVPGITKNDTETA